MSEFRELYIQLPEDAFEINAVRQLIIGSKRLPDYYPHEHLHVIEYSALEQGKA